MTIIIFFLQLKQVQILNRNNKIMKGLEKDESAQYILELNAKYKILKTFMIFQYLTFYYCFF